LKLFVRPRIDLLVYIVIQYVLPDKRRKWLQHTNTLEFPQWYKSFKQSWRACYDTASKSGIQVTLERGERLYGTNQANWTCGCPYYQEKPHKLCKHLVGRLDKAPGMAYPSPPPWNYSTFSNLPPFLRFDLPPIRNQNTDLPGRENINLNQAQVLTANNTGTSSNIADDVAPEEYAPEDHVDLIPEEQADQAERPSPVFVTHLRDFLIAAKDNSRQENHFYNMLQRVDRYNELYRYIMEWKSERSRTIRAQHTRTHALGSQYDR